MNIGIDLLASFKSIASPPASQHPAFLDFYEYEQDLELNFIVSGQYITSYCLDYGAWE